MESRTKKYCRIFYKTSFYKHHKRVRPIYLHTDKTPWIVPLALRNTSLQGSVDTADSKMEELLKTPPIPQIAPLRGARTLNKDIYTIEICKG